MSFTVELLLKGDGRRKAEEAVGEAVRALVGNPRIKEYFATHPNLHTVSPDTFLAQISRKRGARLIESGIFDSEEFSLDPDRVIPRGRNIDVLIPFPLLLAGLDLLPPTPLKNLPPVDVLFENEEWLAINKPHDIPSAPIRSDETDSAVHRALLHCPTLPVLRGNPLEPGLMHRLDNSTGGVLLFVKSVAAFERLDRDWNSGRVQKIYRAVVSHLPEEWKSLPKRADLRIGHDEKSKKKMRVQLTPADAKKLRGEAMSARTEIVRATKTVNGLIDLEIRIETGIHHQIRVTLAHFGAPILGDSVYGGAPSERLWLQAWKLVLPRAGNSSLEITAPLPETWPSQS